MRITTRFGDGGKTKMCGGRTVSKCDPRIKAQGALDELVSLLGLARTKIKDPSVKKKVRLIQADLFKIMAAISSGAKGGGKAPIRQSDVRMLEQFGDMIERGCAMPAAFVVPGVNESSAVLHVARAVARRAECSVAELGKKYAPDACVMAYLNRLSDLLFILAVYEEGKPDPLKT